MTDVDGGTQEGKRSGSTGEEVGGQVLRVNKKGIKKGSRDRKPFTGAGWRRKPRGEESEDVGPSRQASWKLKVSATDVKSREKKDLRNWLEIGAQIAGHPRGNNNNIQ